MIAKDYLSQTYRIDQRINSKLEQVTALRDLTAKATMTFSDMPHNTIRNFHTREKIIDKIIDLESEINADIDALVDLKREVVQLIKRIENTEYQNLLEQRYLCFKSWEHIAVDMGYELRYLHKLHGRALECCDAIINREVDTKRHY